MSVRRVACRAAVSMSRGMLVNIGPISQPTPVGILRESVMVDCSHGNSHKDHLRQPDVAASIADQIASGSRQIFGAMIESHLVEGRQDYVPGQPAVYGQSITDACLSIEQTEPILERLARARRARG